MKKENIISINIDTTGLNPRAGRDEILKLSIINGNEEILFSEVFKPVKRKQWSQKCRDVHKINKADVADKRNIADCKEEIESIFEEADIILGYGIRQFDFPLLKNAGINTVAYKDKILDVMESYKEKYNNDIVFGKEYADFKWTGLIELAKTIDYEYSYPDKNGRLRKTDNVTLRTPKTSLGNEFIALRYYLKEYSDLIEPDISEAVLPNEDCQNSKSNRKSILSRIKSFFFETDD